MHPLRLAGTEGFHGHEGLRRFLAAHEQRAAQITFEVAEVRPLDQAQATARVRLRIADDQVAALTAILTVTGGKVSEVRVYFSDEALLSEVGHIPRRSRAAG